MVKAIWDLEEQSEKAIRHILEISQPRPTRYEADEMGLLQPIYSLTRASDHDEPNVTNDNDVDQRNH